MLAIDGIFRRRRMPRAPDPPSRDGGGRIDGHRITGAVATHERVAEVLDVGHPHRQAALELCSDLAARALLRISSSEPSARDRQPARLVLTITPTAIRIEARGAGIDETVGDRRAADRLATRWGTTHHRHDCTVWYELGELGRV